MRVLVMGGTGFIGTPLTAAFAEKGYSVVVLSRHPRPSKPDGRISFMPWNGTDAAQLQAYVEGCDAVVNLVGESIASPKWTPERKLVLENSRVNAASALATAIISAQHKPKVVVQASAVGFYGYDYWKRAEVDDFSEKGRGFLADLTEKWENAILPVEEYVDRLVIVRSGVVLAKHGGMLQRLLPIFKYGLGGKLGDGYQPFAWISLADEVAAIAYLAADDAAVGVYNLVSPQYTNNREFTKALGESLHRPTLFTVPKCVLRLVYGKQMADELLLGGKFVEPQRLLAQGYKFIHPNIGDALLN